MKYKKGFKLFSRNMSGDNDAGDWEGEDRILFTFWCFTLVFSWIEVAFSNFRFYFIKCKLNYNYIKYKL